VKATNQPYVIADSDARISEILAAADDSFAEVAAIPDLNRLTYTNGFYVECAALFIDIRGSSQLVAKHRSSTLGKLYRAYISESIAVMNQDANCGEIFIQGDCVGAVFHTPTNADINSVFFRAGQLNSLINLLNWRLEQRGYSQIKCGIGMSIGRALMIKAGYKGSAINDVIWMGNVVNEAAKLCHKGNRELHAPIGQQLRPCPPESVALFAEIYWILLLGPTNLRAAKKRERIRHVWSMAPSPIAPFPTDFANSPFLNEEALSGLGSAGPGFNMYQWKELQFAVIAFQDLMGMDFNVRSLLLSEPWAFAEWLDQFKEADGRQFYHCLCHLMFPDEFERIFSERDKAKLARSSALGISSSSFNDRPSRDQALLTARQALEAAKGSTEIDFYKDPPILLRSNILKRPKIEALDLTALSAGVDDEQLDDAEIEEVDTLTPDDRKPINRIYFGPPGTGKTFAMENLRRERYADGEHIEFVSFHPSYSYEDFIEGFRPEPGKNGQLSDKPVKGPFRLICERAHAYPQDRHTLFIDEINRANVAKVFGELITILETSKRCDPGVKVEGLSSSVRLQYSGEKLAVPRNLDIIASMNTADRSVTAIDHALRRRFEFIECPADPERIEPPMVGAIDLRKLLAAINDRLEFLLDRDHAIGHAMLMNIGGVEELRAAFSTKIIPLLMEYFFEDSLRAKIALTGKAGATVFFEERPLSPSVLFEGCEDLVGTEKRLAISPAKNIEQWTELDFRLLYDRSAKALDEPVPAELGGVKVQGAAASPDAAPGL
jgi:5-methylcytosine-specific restriction protein B